ncbi:U3 small nucleolar RNA-associated protein 14 homolog A-like [Haliotis cracherodii]|uniref:U3 small nucleolar RNA-associated protein 14 homolog A-like n=1 Tax=Haliotis cracherodii TaxID=6455 RepID=UPI0039E8015C
MADLTAATMEEGDFLTGDHVLQASDEEEDHVEADRKHAKLLDSISALDGKRRSKLSERTVLTETVSEFGFSQARAERKVRLHELIGSLQHTTSHGELKKQLRAVHRRTKVAPVPLSKVEETKIQRTTAYEKTKDDLTKWNSVVADNRKAEQISFPLQQPSVKLQTTDEVKTRYKPRTPLEMEIAALLQKHSDSVGSRDKELTPAEEQALNAMSLEEAQERRAELQKYRALLTYKQARAKREKKIKSKKYHRILKKEKLKQEKARLEELQRIDPEAYVEKLQQLDRDRVQERMTLKHRGGSKFAQRQKIYGKYDDRSRDAVQSMIQMNKELTKKTQLEEDGNSDSEGGVSMHSDGEEEMIVSQIGMARGDNPWMTARPKVSEFQRPGTVDNTEQGTVSDEGEASEVEEQQDGPEEEQDEVDEEDQDGPEEEDESEDNNTSNLSKERSSGVTSKKRKSESDSEKTEVVASSKNKRKRRKRKKVNNSDEGDRGKGDTIDSIFSHLSESRLQIAKMLESDEKEISGKKKKKKNKRKKSNHGDGEMDSKKESDDEEDGDLMDLSLNRKKTLEDMEGDFEESGKQKGSSKSGGKKLKTESGPTEKTKTEDVFVDPKKLFTLETKLSHSAAVDIITDEDGGMDFEEQQRMTIAQAFADDDVVDEFTKEKANIADRDKPKSIDLSLPGWGEWGGTGLKPSKKKKKRFTLKGPDAAPRRDRDLGNVIISEKLDDAIAKHQVARLPFPYTSPQQFEQSIRAPVGKNWNPETAFRKMIQPKVLTKLGTVIKPIDKSEVFEKEKQQPESTAAMKFGHTDGKKMSAKRKRKGK